MKRRLPPLSAVVAFESAARHKSFKKAGDELCVTPSAISHQVRALEDWLGCKLFERSTRAVALTDSGTRYMLELGLLLDRLEKFSNAEAARRETKNIITLQTTDSFASRWLIPRLSEFEALHPEIDIKIITRDFRDDLRGSEADIGILFMADTSNCTSTNKNTRLLFREDIFPVCSPKILTGHQSLRAADLANFTLIHDDNIGVSWVDWFSTTTATAADKDGPRYNHSHLALQAAELGNGVTLASNILTADAREKGRLVAPFTERIVTGRGYCLVQSEKAGVRSRCKPFTKWVCARAAPHLKEA